MSEAEQAAVYLRLKKESKLIQNELAALAADIKTAGNHFAVLSESLKNCNTGNVSWDAYENLLAELRKKSLRYEQLKIEKADKESQLSKFTEFN